MRFLSRFLAALRGGGSWLVFRGSWVILRMGGPFEIGFVWLCIGFVLGSFLRRPEGRLFS